MDNWRTQHGATWELVFDEETQMGRTLFNGREPGEALPGSTAEWFALARAFLSDAQGMLGLDDDTLVDDRVLLLPLGMVGTTDKTTVRFRQAVSGVPVRGGFANALFDMQGRLLCLDHDALPDLSGFDVTPTVSSNAASDEAVQAFTAQAGEPPTSVSTPVLVIFQAIQGTTRSGALAWEIDAVTEDSGYRYWISATNAPSVIDWEFLIHECFPQQGQTTISGNVKGDVTVGAPDWLADPGDGSGLVRVPMSHMFLRRASNDSIITVTKGGGAFSFAGGLTPVDILLRFQGPYVDVCNLTGSSLLFPNCADPSERDDHEQPETVTINGPNNLVVNPAYDEIIEAQANAFYRVNQMRDWIRSVNPFDDTFDSGAPYTIRPNLNAGCGAAFREELKIIYSSRFRPGMFGCVINFSFASVLWHEMGHWMNVRYGRGNSRLGFGEGLADVWSMYQTDFHRVGDPAFQSRNGNNNRCFCGDCPPCGYDDNCGNGCQGCHSLPGTPGHINGLPLMGALWKVRQNLELNPNLGHDLGAAIADGLFLGWMNAFSLGRIKSVIEYQWLILDDDDGIIGNGTPNLTDIDAGFLGNGFPGLSMPPIRMVCQ